jgi:hypothetical protein
MVECMTPADFRKRLYAQLVDSGFRIAKGGAVKDSRGGRVIVCSSVDARTHSLAVSFGLFIEAAGGPTPEQYNHSHIYGGVGNLTPTLGAMYLELFRKNPDTMQAFLDAVPRELVPALNDLSIVDEVAAAFGRGMFSRCMVTKEARSYLSGVLTI